MKFLLVIVVVAIAVAWILGRSGRVGRRKGPPPSPSHAPPPAATPVATEMLACAHCKVHLPRDDAQFDLAGRPFCSAEHRVAGPR